VTDLPGALVDTNVLVDILFDDPTWAPWSIRQIEMASLRGRLAINEIVYAELSVRAPSIEQLDAALDEAGLDLTATPRAALFVAGKAFAAYRAQGGPRNSILPVFFIGAHAAVLGVPLLTRDARRYRTYFPTVELVTP
jgi:predicted nucleic acid-binding protein